MRDAENIKSDVHEPTSIAALAELIKELTPEEIKNFLKAHPLRSSELITTLDDIQVLVEAKLSKVQTLTVLCEFKEELPKLISSKDDLKRLIAILPISIDCGYLFRLIFTTLQHKAAEFIKTRRDIDDLFRTENAIMPSNDDIIRGRELYDKSHRVIAVWTNFIISKEDYVHVHIKELAPKSLGNPMRLSSSDCTSYGPARYTLDVFWPLDEYRPALIADVRAELLLQNDFRSLRGLTPYKLPAAALDEWQSSNVYVPAIVKGGFFAPPTATRELPDSVSLDNPQLVTPP